MLSEIKFGKRFFYIFLLKHVFVISHFKIFISFFNVKCIATTCITFIFFIKNYEVYNSFRENRKRHFILRLLVVVTYACDTLSLTKHNI